MRMSRSSTVLAVAVVALMAGCSRRATPVEQGINDQVLHIGNQIEPADLDPHIVTGVGEFHILSALLEGLVGEDPKDLHPVPAAAERWEVSADGRTYTFHLRRNAVWTNGDPVTASDFVFSFQRILAPALGSEYAYMLYVMKNAKRYSKGSLTDFSQVGCQAVDSFTLRIELNSPTAYFPSLLTHHSWFPVHPATILKFGKQDQRGTQWTRPGNFVGNGPFTLEKWAVNEIITVKKNPRYWDSGQVRLSAINFYPIENLQTEERAFRTGQLHLTANLPLNRIDWYKAHEPSLLRIDPYLGTYFYLLNVTRPPLDDPRVRRALALAIDRTTLVERVLKGGQLPGACLTPANTAGYTCNASVGFDTLAARRLLVEAGYSTGGKRMPALSLLYNTSEAHQTVAQAIQQMWKQYLGIDVTLVNQEWKVYNASLQRRDFVVARRGWIADYNDPNTFLDLFITGGGNNPTGWSNATYDSCIAAASCAPERAGRYGLFQQAEKLLLEQMPVIPIYFYTNVYLLDPSVQGWYPNALNHHPFKYVYLAKAK